MVLFADANNISNDSNDVFDFVIVGAGPSAAGIVHAFQQQHQQSVRVAMVESGTARANRQPLDHWCRDAFDSRSTLSTGYEPYAHQVRAGKGLGGGSLIHGGLVVPPAVEDIKDWDFCTVDEFRTALGELQSVLSPARAPPATCARLVAADPPMVSAATTRGFLDYNTVYTQVPHTRDPHNGQRISYFDYLVDDVDPNITVFLGWKAVCVTGRSVTLRRPSATTTQHTLRARHEVILCGGALETPALLASSGDDDGTSYYAFQDHLGLPRAYLTWPCRNGGGVRTLATLQSKTTGVKCQVMVYEAGSISTCDLVVQMGTMHLPDPWRSLARGVLHWVVHWTPMRWVVQYCVTVVNVFLLNVEAVGSIRVSKGTVSVYPSQPSASDMEKLHHAWELSKNILAVDGIEIFPVLWSKLFCRLFYMPYFHYMGSCKQLVDRELRLKPGIRICDASILPRLTSGPPALTCATVGLLLGKKLMLEARQG